MLRISRYNMYAFVTHWLFTTSQKLMWRGHRKGAHLHSRPTVPHSQRRRLGEWELGCDSSLQQEWNHLSALPNICTHDLNALPLLLSYNARGIHKKRVQLMARGVI